MANYNKELAIVKLKACQHKRDKEAEHILADEVLCELLIALGYADVVEEWRKVGKWYA